MMTHLSMLLDVIPCAVTGVLHAESVHMADRRMLSVQVGAVYVLSGVITEAVDRKSPYLSQALRPRGMGACHQHSSSAVSNVHI